MGSVGRIGEVAFVVFDDVLPVAVLASNAPDQTGQIVDDAAGDLPQVTSAATMDRSSARTFLLPVTALIGVCVEKLAQHPIFFIDELH